MSATKNLITEYYDCFNKGDTQGFLETLHDDVIHDISQGGREVGKQKFAEFVQRMNHHYQEQARDLVIMVSEDGKRAAAEFIIEGIYLVTDQGLPEAHQQTYRIPCGAFFEIRDGKVYRISNHYNLKDWISQVSA